MVPIIHRISNPQITKTLTRMHKEASRQGLTLMKGLAKSIFRPLRPEDLKDAYIALSQEQGEYVYDLILQKKSKHIIEFGTSFGISTLYLGAAAKENGGKVITTELLPEKCRIAQQNFDEAGLQDWIDLREGDALETLKDVEDGIDFLLMDGWNDLYHPLLHILEPKLKKGAVIYTDNAGFPGTQPFIDHLESRPEKYRSQRIYNSKGGVLLTQVIS